MIVRAVYVLSSSGATFRALLAEVLHDLSYIPSKIDPAVFMWQAVKNNGLNITSMSSVMLMMLSA